MLTPDLTIPVIEETTCFLVLFGLMLADILMLSLLESGKVVVLFVSLAPIVVLPIAEQLPVLLTEVTCRQSHGDSSAEVVRDIHHHWQRPPLGGTPCSGEQFVSSIPVPTISTLLRSRVL